MIDYSKLLRKLNPEPGGEDILRLRTGVVDAVNANGTLDVGISGLVVPGVPRLSNITAAVGDIVQVISFRGALLVIGAVAGDAAGRVSNRINTSVRTSNSSGFTTTETVTDTVTATLVAGRVYKIYAWLLVGSTVAADSVNVRLRENNLAGTQLQQARIDCPLTGTVFPVPIEAEYTAVATGSKTFVATGVRSTGSGTITLGAAGTQPVYLYVDYIRG